MTRTQRVQYSRGRAAAVAGESTEACPFGTAYQSLRSYWLAGWHQWHIEKRTGIMS